MKTYALTGGLGRRPRCEKLPQMTGRGVHMVHGVAWCIALIVNLTSLRYLSEREREGRRKGGRKGGREEGRKGGLEGRRDGGREGGRERVCV